MPAAFQNGDGVIVTAYGPGLIHLLSYASNSNIANHVGTISTKAGTTEYDTTRFMISHSYTFTRFAFYWEGKGQAVFGVGQDLTRTAVGGSWTDATLVSWGGTGAARGDVAAEAAKGLPRDNQVTCFVIPDRLL